MADKLKKRNWTMLLYPEDSTHVAAMDLLEKGGYKYVAIKHDKDIWSEGESDSHEAGEPKKEHWHVVLKFSQARYNTAVAKELGIEPNYLQPCANFDSACLYLVHANAEEKYQYDPSALFGTIVPSVLKLLSDDDEGTRVLEIVKTVQAIPGRAKYTDLLIWACKNGYYGEFRRLGTGVGFLINEHNEEIYMSDDAIERRADYEADKFKDFLDTKKWEQKTFGV